MVSTSISAAFVPTLALVPRTSAATSTFLNRKPFYAPPPVMTRTSPLFMALQTDSKTEGSTSTFSRLEENRRAKIASEYRGPQGFTPYAEKVNGRVAQMGFVIGLITEIASGKPIGEQMLIMFSPLTHLFTALIHSIGA